MTVAKCTLRLILALISLSMLVPQLTTKAWADSYAIASFEPPPVEMPPVVVQLAAVRALSRQLACLVPLQHLVP
jgi:hypothetical protein